MSQLCMYTGASSLRAARYPPKENRIQLPRIGPRGRDLIVALQGDANDSVLYHSLSELEMGEAQKGNPQQKIGALYEQRVYRS